MYNESKPKAPSTVLREHYESPTAVPRENLSLSLEALEKQISSTDSYLMALEERLNAILLPYLSEASPKEPEPLGGSGLRHTVDCLTRLVQSINRKLVQISSHIDL